MLTRTTVILLFCLWPVAVAYLAPQQASAETVTVISQEQVSRIVKALEAIAAASCTQYHGGYISHAVQCAQYQGK